eukprot:jgi/Botrbrau1/14096/Bobra.182_3s0041.1
MGEAGGTVRRDRDPEALSDDDFDEEAEAEQAADMAAYQREYENDHSWEALQEDEQGRLRLLDRTEQQRAKRRRLLSAAASARIRRGMIRYLQVVVDLSRAAAMNDMRPNRATVVGAALHSFIREFFNQNPLSHLGLIIMRDGLAHQLTPLSSSPEAHIAKLREALSEPSGDASLQNALDLVVASLSSVPPYGHREALFVFSALCTCDPGNILDSIAATKKAKCRVSVVGLAAEVHVCRSIVQETGGTYGVAMNEAHLEDLISGQAAPPPARASDVGASLVRMGFPQRAGEGEEAAVFVGEEVRLKSGSYTCPRCRARCLELPCQCHVCGLTLISSPALARSYHHLFPVQSFQEVPAADLHLIEGCGGRGKRSPAELAFAQSYCYGCTAELAPDAEGAGGEEALVEETPGVVVQCPSCKHMFCFECDTYIHESLHNCPGCEALSDLWGPQGEAYQPR